MGKATLEPPDSLQAPAPATPGTPSADDLLAQLAGQEIDRLLAESDTDLEELAPESPAPTPSAKTQLSTVSPAAALPAPPVAAPIMQADVSNQLNELFDQLVEGEEEKEPERPAASTVSEASPIPPAAKMNAPAAPEPTVLPAAELEAPEDTPLAEASPIEATPAEEAPPIIIPSVPNVDVPESMVADVVAHAEVATSPAELSALDLSSDSDTVPLLDAESDLVPETESDQPLPAYLRVLTLIAAPLDGCPDWLLDLIGKIALLTLFNAIAVLIYVHFFRKH